MTNDCIFCKIYESRANILYEDEKLFLVADIAPLAEGHLLLVPKEHTEFLHELTDESLYGVLVSVKKIVKTLGYHKYNLLQNNGHMQSIAHVHFHIVPANTNSSLRVDWTTVPVGGPALDSLRKRVTEALK